ncbi:MAG: hypothetical protein C4296_07505 [Gemmataceae bacterium]
MTRNFFGRWGVLGVGFLGFCLVLSGCSRASQQGGPTTEPPHLTKLGRVITRYMANNKGQPPKSEKELRDFVKTLKPDDWKDLNIDPSEDIWTSPRDKQPYKFYFERAAAAEAARLKGDTKAGQTGTPIIAAEQTGVNGKRYVLYSVGGSVVEVTDDEFKKMVGGQ